MPAADEPGRAPGGDFRNVFGGNPLDRVSRERRDQEWIAGQLAAPTTRILPMWRLNLPVRPGEPPTIAWQPLAAADLRTPGSEPALLGTLDGVAHFATDISDREDPVAALGLDDGTTFQDVRAVASTISMDEAGIAAQARALVDWHARHGFCAVCGGKTETLQGGIYRKCTSCGAEHFPRTDPVVITVVTDGHRCLLGRQASWPPGMFSALAGFVDQGESIEDAVRREIGEESGVGVARVRYHSSQPWPFPCSLMIGCHAEALSTDLDIDEDEMDDVAWFSREEVLQALRDPESSPNLRLPGPMAIAHTIIRTWAEGEAG